MSDDVVILNIYETDPIFEFDVEVSSPTKVLDVTEDVESMSLA